MIDNKTTRLELPLPDVDNFLEDDVARLKAAFGILDKAALVGDDNRVPLDSLPENLALLGSDGKLPIATIPALAITDTFPVGSEAEMLALDAQRGDIAIRSDASKSFILAAEPASDLNNWVALTNDVLIQLAQPDGYLNIGGLDKQYGNIWNAREQWRRQMADAGLNLVSGSFEQGATVSTATDAVWFQAGGQCYTWGGSLPKTVGSSSEPTSTGGVSIGGWVAVNDVSLRSELASVQVGKGASLSGWQRDFVLGTINNISQFLNSGNIQLHEYRMLCVNTVVAGATVLDWAPALTQALIDSANQRRIVHAPGEAGGYYLSHMPRFTNLDTSGTNTAMSIFSLVGDGTDNTIFWTDSTESNFLNFYTCRVFIKDFTMQRRGVTILNPDYEALSLLSIGDVTVANGAVRASLISNVRIAGSGTGFQIQHAWDCVFDRLIIQDYGVSGIYINKHDSDNSNNLLFIRPHIETCRHSGASLARAFAMLNGAGGNNRNHGITLVEPHIEPVNWRSMHLYLSYPLHFEVINPLFNRNNNTAYSDSNTSIPAITAAAAQPIIYVNDGVNTHIRGGQAIHIGTQADDVSPIMKFDGIMKGFKFDGFMDTGKATRTSLSAGIDITGCINGMRELDFNGATLNSFTTMSSIGSRLRVTPLNDLQKSMEFVGEQYTPEGTPATAMVMKLYQSNTQDQSTALTELMQIYSTGYLRIKGYLGTRITLAAGASYTFIAGDGVTNRRGKYGIYGLMNDAQMYCEFFNVPGLAPSSIATGTSVNLSQAVPDGTVTAKLCVYQTTANTQYITLENRLSTTINVSLLFWAS